MKITLNGKTKSLSGSISIAALLKDLDLEPDTVVAELNTTIIQPDAYPSQILSEGDQLEIIRFVGGG